MILESGIIIRVIISILTIILFTAESMAADNGGFSGDYKFSASIGIEANKLTLGHSNAEPDEDFDQSSNGNYKGPIGSIGVCRQTSNMNICADFFGGVSWYDTDVVDNAITFKFENTLKQFGINLGVEIPFEGNISIKPFVTLSHVTHELTLTNIDSDTLINDGFVYGAGLEASLNVMDNMDISGYLKYTKGTLEANRNFMKDNNVILEDKDVDATNLSLGLALKYEF